MSNKILNQDQRNHLLSQIKQAKKIDEYKRLCCILSFDTGTSVKDIANQLFLPQSTVYYYLGEFLNENKTSGNDRTGRNESLSEDQIKDLISHLENKTYLKCEPIIAFILDQYGYSKSGVKKLLHRYNFVYKKPIKVPAKLDAEKQREFIDFYSDLKNHIDSKKEVILFADGVHPDHQTQTIYGWIKKGSKLAIKTTAKQMRLHYMGAVNIDSNKVNTITKQYDRINGDAIKDFFKTINSKFHDHQKIHIILDNAGYHKCKSVKNYIRHSKNNKIKLHFLPPYSPNLNLSERIWKIMREKVTYNRYYPTFTEFRTAIINFFNNLNEMQDILTARITDKFQVIKPVFLQN